jgi:ATP-dependent RNA helicase RhlE
LTSPTFEAFGFAEPISRALTQVGYETPTPIQVQAMPPQLEGRDLLGLAETGSGKTATFVLPLLQNIANNPTELGWKQVSTLILAPTRELAVQIDQEVASLARNMHIRRAVVLGGVSKGPQINALKRGVHVCVATPGRLLDLVNMRACDLSSVQTLVIDEADRMFDMGFIRDIKKIVALIPMKRRTALFSATMPPEIKKFAYDMLQDPFRVDLSTKHGVVDRIDQKVMIVRSAEKQSRLHTLLADPACERAIVFTRTKRGADRVAERLAMASINAVAFHGNKAQNARQRALNDFMEGHVKVLVATDIAARGIDVNNITHVINFDMPLDPETYVHRVGRTARKGLSGIAISLCDPSERAEIKAIEKLMKQTIEVIGDVGGEALPMPEKRPHHTHEDPRRVGAHRKGPTSGNRGGDRSSRDDRPSRSEDRAPRRTFDRNDEVRAPRAVEAGGFNPAAELHRPDVVTAPEARPERSERPRFDRPREDRPRSDKPREGGFRQREGGQRDASPRSDGARSENYKPASERPERRPFEARGPKPEWKRDGDKPAHSGPRSDKPRFEGPRSEGPRSDKPRFDGPRGDKPRFDGPRPERADRPKFDGPRPERSDRPARPSSEARGPRPEWKRDGDKPRSEGPRSDKPRYEGPRADGPRSDKPRSDKPRFDGPRTDGPRSAAPHRSGGKPSGGKPTGGKPSGGPGGERNWNGQKPPKFLKQQRDRNPAA